MSPRLPMIALTLILSGGAAHAFTGKCVLQVDGKTYLNGPCPIGLEKGGDFSNGTDGTDTTKPSKYFAMVSIDKDTGTGDGWWNGVDADSHAHDPLGKLTRQGACWVNARAKVCAMK